MSGHSKWHNIQKTKGAADAKRSAAFTKIAKEIIVAVKQGGSGDPANNSRLATVIAKAKAANMPNDNIKRTIDKAQGAGNTDNYESVTYEGYGPCGVAVIVEALTDNRQRTAPEIRHYFDKYGKGMGAQGCVSWSFDRKGVCHGHYYTGLYSSGNYDAVKRDFAVRSGLIPKQQLFQEEQLIEIYRCCTDTLQGGFELSYDQEKTIQEVRKQIEECLPDIMERIQQQDAEPTQEQTM